MLQLNHPRLRQVNHSESRYRVPSDGFTLPNLFINFAFVFCLLWRTWTAISQVFLWPYFDYFLSTDTYFSTLFLSLFFGGCFLYYGKHEFRSLRIYFQYHQNRDAIYALFYFRKLSYLLVYLELQYSLFFLHAGFLLKKNLLHLQYTHPSPHRHTLLYHIVHPLILN